MLNLKINDTKKDVVHTYNGILLSHIREWNNAIYSNMDGPRDYHTEWSKSDKDKYHMISLYMESKNLIQMNLLSRQK